jgi:hypothetical protein
VHLDLYVLCHSVVPDEEGPLPLHWGRHYHGEDESLYYINAATGESTLGDGGCTPAAADPAALSSLTLPVDWPRPDIVAQAARAFYGPQPPATPWSDMERGPLTAGWSRSLVATVQDTCRLGLGYDLPDPPDGTDGSDWRRHVGLPCYRRAGLPCWSTGAVDEDELSDPTFPNSLAELSATPEEMDEIALQLRLHPNYDHYLTSTTLHCTEDKDEKEWHAYEDTIASLDAAGLLPAAFATDSLPADSSDI